VRNPAFDITPAALVTAIVCETGVARPPFGADLSRLMALSFDPDESKPAIR
jgi:methylthioribose-1-phosphate isomerase